MAYRVAVIVGSLRKESWNRKLARALIELAPSSLALEIVEIGQLPLYDQDLDDEKRAPAEWTGFRERVRAFDAVLFVTPEYNRSVPGVLKNAIDHASRPYGDSAFAGKPAGVIGVSIGAIGTACAQQHLRCILAYLDMPTYGQPEAFLKNDVVLEKDGGIAQGSREFLQKWMDGFIAWLRHHA